MITDEELEAAGFVRGRMPGDLVAGPVVRGIDRNGDWYWCVRTYPIPKHAHPKTLEDVLILCRLLGVW